MINFLDRNFLNNLILLVVLLVLANYLSKGSIINVLFKYYEKLRDYLCGDNFENFGNFNYGGSGGSTGFTGKTFQGIGNFFSTTPEIIHDQDFKYIYNSDYNVKELQHRDDKIMKKLFNFLQGLVSISKNFYELNPSNYEEKSLNNSESMLLKNNLNKYLNSSDFSFTNLEIIDELKYYNNFNMKEIQPFRLSSNLRLNSKEIGKIILIIEMNLEFNGYLSITRIKLNNFLKKSKKIITEEESSINIPNIHSETEIKIPIFSEDHTTKHSEEKPRQEKTRQEKTIQEKIRQERKNDNNIENDDDDDNDDEDYNDYNFLNNFTRPENNQKDKTNFIKDTYNKEYEDENNYEEFQNS